ncbi:hypothetical protein RRG08_000511 [Elysia crispata]|uniref:Uncharacterized protein n=1 Tax=Elysia crispata TaxID=231223 RepID=A0AAE0YCP1_9GAST|nr:hypothetical protein RRG08_000511 [Elysia crispata]
MSHETQGKVEKNRQEKQKCNHTVRTYYIVEVTHSETCVSLHRVEITSSSISPLESIKLYTITSGHIACSIALSFTEDFLCWFEPSNCLTTHLVSRPVLTVLSSGV